MRFSPQAEQAISEFLGVPSWDPRNTRHSALGMDSLVEVLLERHSIGQPTPQENLMGAWRQLLGDDAHRCSPLRLENNLLTIAVPNAILRRELMFGKRALLARIQAVEGCSAIRDIRYVAG